jgi:anti-sigma regulatory factor (Ser/Thr protein kinase)
VDPATRDALVLATDELCANVVAHAYPGAPGPLTVDVAVVPAGGRVTVIDAGAPFDPSAVPAPDVGAPLEARAIGGLGLLLVRRSVDALAHARVDGHNVVTLEKRADPAAAPGTPP